MSNRSMTRREWLKLAGASSAAAVLAACAPPRSAPAPGASAPTEAAPGATAVPSGAEQGTLKALVCCYAPPDLDVRNKVNADFEAANPGITLDQELLPAGQNYFEKLQTLLAAGTPPDVFDMWEGYVQPYAELGALMNLDPFLAADPKVKKDDILPVALDASSWRNSVYAWIIGFIPGPVSLYYNEQHFTDAGVAAPTADWTWDDMRDAASKLTTDTNSDNTPDRYGLIFDNWFVMWLYWLWSNGGDVFNADQTKSTLTDPKVEEAITYWANLVNTDKVAATGSTLQSLGGSVAAFQGGAASMYLGNAWDVGTLKESQDLKWQAVLSPKAPNGNRAWYMHLQCWAISSQTKLPNAAWAYIRDFVLAYEPAIQTIAPTIPALKQLVNSFDTETTRQLGYQPLVQMADQPGFARIPGSGAKWDKIAGMIQSELDLVFADQKQTVAEALTKAATAVDAELARQ